MDVRIANLRSSADALVYVANMRNIFFFLAAACALFFSAHDVQAAQLSGFVDVSGTSFVLDGREFIPRGVNDHDVLSLWDSSRKLPNEAGFTAHAKDFKSLGFNSVRLAVKSDYFESPQGFVWLDKRVREAEKYGYKIILDMHIPSGGAQQDYQPNAENEKFWLSEDLQSRFIRVWGKIAERYAASSAIWAYDMLNEPASREVNRVSSLMQHVHDAIREKDKRHVIILQPVQVYDETYRESFVYPPVEDKRLAYSIHFYRPYGFTVKNVPWGINDHRVIERYPAATSTDGAWDAARIADDFQTAGLQAARAKGVPAVIGEFGAIFHSELSGQYFWIEDALAAARKAGLGWQYWVYQTPDLPGSYGLIDGKKFKRKQILKLLSETARLKPAAYRLP